MRITNKLCPQHLTHFNPSKVNLITFFTCCVYYTLVENFSFFMFFFSFFFPFLLRGPLLPFLRIESLQAEQKIIIMQFPVNIHHTELLFAVTFFMAKDKDRKFH